MMKNKLKIFNQTTKEILIDLLKLGGLFAIIILAPNAIQMLKLFDNRYPKRKFQNSFRYLKNKKYIEFTAYGEKSKLKLTPRGRKQALKYFLDDLKIKKQQKWDKKWRMVIFDIPERKRVARDILRNKLIELGFYKLQNSVFVFPYPCKTEIDQIIDFYFLRKYVYYIEINRIYSDDKLIKTFQLSFINDK